MRIVADRRGIISSNPEETTTFTVSGSLSLAGSGSLLSINGVQAATTAYVDSGVTASLARAVTSGPGQTNTLIEGFFDRNPDKIPAYSGVNGSRCRSNAGSIIDFDGLTRQNAQLFSISNGGGSRADYFVASHTGVATLAFYGILPAGQSSCAGTITIYRSSDNVQMGTLAFSLTSAVVLYSCTANLIGGTEYYWVFNVPYIASNVQALLSRLKLSIDTSGGTGIFAGSFTRYVTPPWLWGNLRYDRQSRYDYVNPHSVFVIDTDAPSIVVEYVATIITPGFDRIMIEVDGEPWATVAPTNITQKNLSSEITLPPGHKRVGIRNSPQSFNNGTFTCAVYLSSAYSATIVPEPNGPTLLIIGDSIWSGLIAETTIAAGSNGAVLPQSTIFVATTADLDFGGTILLTNSAGATQTITYTSKDGTHIFGAAGGSGSMTTGGAIAPGLSPAQGAGALVQRRIPDRLVFDTYGGFKLSGVTSDVDGSQFGYFTSGSAVSDNLLRAASRQRWKRAQPTSIYVALTTNDISQGITGANTLIATNQLLDDLHADHPGAIIYVQTAPPYAAKESGQGADKNAPDIRAAQVAAVGTRSYCVAILGDAIVSGFGVKMFIGTDGIHPTRDGHAMLADIAVRGMNRG